MSRDRARPGIPSDWEVVGDRGFGPFVTEERYLRPDGTSATWSSRAQRKGHGLQQARSTHRWLVLLWRPRRLTWWIASMFIVGSALFALGSFPAYFKSLDPRVVGITFFVGSVFFTSAASLQFIEAVNAPTNVTTGAAAVRTWRVWTWQPRRIDIWATTIQLVGTLLFNLSTFTALIESLDVQQEERLVWAPDMLGSIAFLTASYLAYAEVCHRAWCWRQPGVSWSIVALNLLGSVSFGVAAVAAFVLPTTGEVLNITLVNGGTFVGAICFLLGAYLLMPEMLLKERGEGPSGTP